MQHNRKWGCLGTDAPNPPVPLMWGHTYSTVGLCSLNFRPLAGECPHDRDRPARQVQMTRLGTYDSEKSTNNYKKDGFNRVTRMIPLYTSKARKYNLKNFSIYKNLLKNQTWDNSKKSFIKPLYRNL